MSCSHFVVVRGIAIIGTSVEELVVPMSQTSLPAASVSMQFYDNGGGSADDP